MDCTKDTPPESTKEIPKFQAELDSWLGVLPSVGECGRPILTNGQLHGAVAIQRIV